MTELLLLEGAERDYTESLKWYASRSKRAAEGFEADVREALQAIATDPDLYPLCDDKHHFFLLRRYPFQIIYRRVDEKLLVVAVAHTSRNPGYWSQR